MNARVVLLVVAALTLCWSSARAEDPTSLQRMKFIEVGTVLTVQGDVANLFDSKAYEALDNGLPATVVIRLWVYRKDSTTPIAYTALERSVVYDLWDEVYVITLRSAGRKQTVQVSYRAEALKLLTSLDGTAIARLADIPYEDHHVLAVVAELNPVSSETVTEVRRWLSKGGGGGMERGGSFFGSFVSVFVNPRLPKADRVTRLRSQPFYRELPK